MNCVIILAAQGSNHFFPTIKLTKASWNKSGDTQFFAFDWRRALTKTENRLNIDVLSLRVNTRSFFQVGVFKLYEEASRKGKLNCELEISE